MKTSQNKYLNISHEAQREYLNKSSSKLKSRRNKHTQEQ